MSTTLDKELSISDDLFAEVRFTISRNRSEEKRLRRMLLEINEAGVTQRELARRIDVPLGTLTHWIRTAKQDRADALSVSLAQ